MSFGFGISNAGVNRLGRVSYLCGDIQSLQQGGDVRRSGVMVVAMVVVVVMMVLMDMALILSATQSHIVAVLLLTTDGDVHVGAGDAAGDGLPGVNFHAGKQAVHGLQKIMLFGFSHQLVQRRHQHIAGGAHVAFQI